LRAFFASVALTARCSNPLPTDRSARGNWRVLQNFSPLGQVFAEQGAASGAISGERAQQDVDRGAQA
jgi:hypothetical protein